MLDFLTNLEINIVVGAVALLGGVVFSTKIKDWFKGIPSQLRVAINSVETDSLAKIKAAQAQVLAQIAPPVPAAKVALTPAQQPLVPAPAPVVLAPVVLPAAEPAAPAPTPTA